MNHVFNQALAVRRHCGKKFRRKKLQVLRSAMTAQTQLHYVGKGCESRAQVNTHTQSFVDTVPMSHNVMSVY